MVKILFLLSVTPSGHLSSDRFFSAKPVAGFIQNYFGNISLKHLTFHSRFSYFVVYLFPFDKKLKKNIVPPSSNPVSILKIKTYYHSSKVEKF